MKIIAHRCGTDKHPEQTIASALHSLKNGADYVEVDIRFTSDNIPVVIHDSTPEKLYGIDTPVSEMSVEEFLSLRRIEDVSVCGHSFIHFLQCGIDRMLFHCKEGGENLKIILDLCEKYHISDKVVFGVQTSDDVSLIKNCNKEIKVLAFMPKVTDIHDFANAGADYIRLWEKWLTEENIASVKAAGKKLWIMSDSPTVGEVTENSYDFYYRCNADGILVNKVIPAIEYFNKL